AQLPAPLAVHDRDLRLVEQLAPSEPGADLGTQIAGAGHRETRPVRSGAGEHDAVAEHQLDHLAVALDAPARLLDRVHEPGEDRAAQDPLRLDDRQEVFRHSAISSSATKDTSRSGSRGAGSGAGAAIRLAGSTARTAATVPAPSPTCSAAR